VPDTLAILEEGAVSVVAEVALHIPHCLVGPAGATRETVRVVHSHPMALAQCRAALNGRYERVAASTTSEAARTVAALDDITVAAIASPLAARRHGLTIIAEEISDHPENLTRFVALARFTRLDHDTHTEWHTALRLITRHEPGALHDAIEPLRYHGVQMTSLHSRPIMGEPWRYQFYIDVEGHRSAPRVLRALRDVAERSAELHVLGSYPVSRGVR
jgi:chorismate mutase / prephenate dehydratase